MPLERLARFVALPELEVTGVLNKPNGAYLEAKKTSTFEVCPKCATQAFGVYDRRWVTVKDAPVRLQSISLRILKRRFYCKTCKKPFTEPVPGIGKGHRTTARYRRILYWACDNFESLKKARDYLKCSTSTLYRLYYQQLDLELRKRSYSWPKSIGIDEHKYAKHSIKRYPEFATVFIDHRGKRVYEVAKDRDVLGVQKQIAHIPGRENVRFATIDLSSTYRKLIKESFPNARIVADKFHVVRLLHPAINRHRKEITGDKRSLPIRRILLRSGKKLDHFTRSALHRWLEQHHDLREIYMAKESIHGLYRIRGYHRAKKALGKMLDAFGRSSVKEVLSLRRTLLSWRKEILEYFRTSMTNGRTEAFNGKAKLIRKKGYGFRSFKNYRLRLLMC